MPKIQMIDIKGNPVEEVELSEGLFDAPVSTHAVYLVVKNILANNRQGTHLSLIHISEPTRQCCTSRMPSSA